jgi:hypothetical protein
MLTIPPIGLTAPKSSADPPDVIFGANLDAWFDSALGITTANGTGVDRVIQWDCQVAARDGRGADNVNRPEYIAVGAGGTPTVRGDIGVSNRCNLLTTGVALPQRQDQTVYALVRPTADVGLKSLTYGSVGFYVHGDNGGTVEYPGIFRIAWYTPAQADVTAYAVIRWSARNAVQAANVSVDVVGELATAAFVWDVAGNWTWCLGRDVAAQGFHGDLKEYFFVNQYVIDADAEHAQVLDYFKAKYPTLVSY